MVAGAKELGALFARTILMSEKIINVREKMGAIVRFDDGLREAAWT